MLAFFTVRTCGALNPNPPRQPYWPAIFTCFPITMDVIEDSARSFAQAYADLFAKPECSTSGAIAGVAAEIGTYYRPGVTFFTNGKITRFEVIALLPDYHVRRTVLIFARDTIRIRKMQVT